MPGTLQIDTLGGLQLWLDGRPFDGLRSRKVAALLVYLAYDCRPVPRERLAALFWPDSAQERAMTNVRVALHDLRRNLAPFLHVGRENVALTAGAGVRLDARELLLALEAAGGQASALRPAVNRYGGEFLEGFFLRGAPAFENWAATQREAIHQGVLDAYRLIVKSDQRRRAYQPGMTAARRWLALDPLAEDAHRLLMQMLAASGQQAEALAHFDEVKSVLEAELGVGPDPATEELAGQIADGQWSPTLVPADTVTAAARQALHPAALLPADQTPFLGREAELALLEERLSDSGVRLVTLTGPGGMGKTRLALAAARMMEQSRVFEHGVLFIDLSDLEQAAQIPLAIAAGLGLEPAADMDVRGQVESYLRQRRLLLVLDNLEQIAGAAEYLGILLRAAAWLTVLATSRERLWLQAEHVMRLEGLPYEDGSGEADLAHAAAQLFLAAARRARHDFQLNAANGAAVAGLCRLVEGMPLALELAAGRVVTLSVPQVLSEIRACYEVLATEMRDLPARHRSIQAVFDSTWAQLDESEKALLAAFSVFRGGGERKAVEKVAGKHGTELRTLVRKNLLRLEPDSDRVTIHELLRQFAASKLAADAMAEARARRLHRDYYLSWLAMQKRSLPGAEQELVLDVVQRDGANVRRAWRYAVTTEESALIDQAADVLGFFYLWRNRYEEGHAAFRAATASGSEQAALQGTAAARLLTWQGVFAARLQEKEEAESLCRNALALLADLPADTDKWQEPAARANRRLAELLLETGRLEEAQVFAAQALALAEEAGSTWEAGAAHFVLGDLANSGGLYPAALGHFEEALSRFRAKGDERSQARVLQRMSYAARDLGRLEDGQRYVEEALRLLEKGNDREQLAVAYLAMGWLLLYQGRFERAREDIERSVALYQELGLPAPLAVLGIVYQELGRYDDAQRILANEVAASRARGLHVELSFAENALSVIHLIHGRYDEALALLQESEALLKDSDLRDRRAQAPSLKGYVARASGSPGRAAANFCRAVRASLEINSIIPLLFAVPGMALLLADEGRINEALRIYAPLARMPLVANSVMRADLAGRELARRAGLTLADLAENQESAAWSPWDAAHAALNLFNHDVAGAKTGRNA
ncbi:MAG: ATP-binding protein [Candidatus Promineifilaceae bacterium]